ncbi:MAG: spore gernimation protein [Bacilli bacterium]|nr:spore gernimation protein [Bacilli bacterium]
MIIHVVKAGETLASIARMYRVTPAEIVQVSQPPDPNQLVPGQTLLIPIQPQTNRPTIEINAYLEPAGTQADIDNVSPAASQLTYLAIFSYQVQSDGSLTRPNDDTALSFARRSRIAPMLAVTNFSAGKFQSDVARTILRNVDIQNRMINELFTIMSQKGYRGINIDFEYIYPDDRESYNQFLRNLVAKAKPRGFFVATALAPKRSATQTGLLYEAHDYAAHGQIVDFAILMTYEYGWSGGPPMAVAPPNQVRQVLQYAVSVMPRNKIMMGMPLYGYDWTLPYVKGGQWAKRVSTQQAYLLAAAHGSTIQFDSNSQSPYFHYQEAGKSHVVWFEDARSMDAKFNLIKEFQLRGGSYWELGSPFPQNWALLSDRFTIKKI